MTEVPAAIAPTAVVDPKAGLEQNDRKYPRIGSTIRAIWDWCDAFNEARGTAPARAELLETLQPAGFHPATLATQYAAWRRFHGITGTIADPAKALKTAETEAAKEAKAAEKAAAAAEKAAAKAAAAAEKAAAKEAAAAEKAAAKEAAAAEKAAAKEAAAAEKAAAKEAAADDVPPAPGE
jgi:hypothetical protein